MKAKRDVLAPMTGPEYGCAMGALVEGGFEPSGFVLEERRSNVRQPGGGWPKEFGRDLGLLTFGSRGSHSARGPR